MENNNIETQNLKEEILNFLLTDNNLTEIFSFIEIKEFVNTLHNINENKDFDFNNFYHNVLNTYKIIKTDIGFIFTSSVNNNQIQFDLNNIDDTMIDIFQSKEHCIKVLISGIYRNLIAKIYHFQTQISNN